MTGFEGGEGICSDELCMLRSGVWGPLCLSSL